MTDNAETPPRWSRMGVTKRECDSAVRSAQRDMQTLGMYEDLMTWSPETPCCGSHTGRQRDLCMFYDILTLEHLQYSHPFGSSEENLSRLASVAIDFFCGAWRDRAVDANLTFDRAQGRRKFDWEGELRMSLGALALARRREDLLQVAAFVDRDLPLDDDLYGRTKFDCMFLEALAWRLVHGDFGGCQDLIEAVRKGRGKRPRAMLECLEAIDSGEPEKIRASLLQVVKLYRSAEFDPTRWNFAVSVDATLLWNIAEMWACAPTDLPQESMDHIITRSSLGLDAAGVVGN